MLSRKVERLDSVKPWQPFGYEEGATFYSQNGGKDNGLITAFFIAFSMDFMIK